MIELHTPHLIKENSQLNPVLNADEDVELASSYSNQYALVDAQY